MIDLLCVCFFSVKSCIGKKQPLSAACNGSGSEFCTKYLYTLWLFPHFLNSIPYPTAEFNRKIPTYRAKFPRKNPKSRFFLPQTIERADRFLYNIHRYHPETGCTLSMIPHPVIFPGNRVYPYYIKENITWLI